MDKETRKEFGDYIEEYKRMTGREDLTYHELIGLGKEFLGD
jgi:hypothetical protein